jgi:tetratricopeptide (TPR) repeat protein
MKQFFILISILSVSFGLAAQDTLQQATQHVPQQADENVLPQNNQDILQQANEAYSKGDFNAAIDLYEKALKENGQSALVYYNLGNSYYKTNKVALSILNYERAFLLDPGDQDIRFNLNIARLKTVDKIEPVGEFFLSSWFKDIRNLLSTDEWSRFAITCFILLVACLFLFFFTRRIFIKKIGFYAGIGLLVFVVAGNIFAYNQKKQLTQRNMAIVLVQTTTIKSSPDNSGTDYFILHEGTKVKLKTKLSNWTEIETADGSVGWIKNEEIEII